MNAPPAIERDGVRITPLGRPIHEELPSADVAAWRSGPGEASHAEQQAEEKGRERDIAAQGWKDELFVPAVRAKLQALFGAPAGRGDDYKMSFEYALRVETPAGTALLSIADWKSWGIVVMQEYSASTPEARRLARGALWHAVADAPLADFEDRFGYDEAAGVAYGCRGGRPWMDVDTLGARVQESWDAEARDLAAEAAAEGRRRGIPWGMWTGWAASLATGFGVGARWGWAAGFLAFVVIWVALKPIIRKLYRRR